MTGVVTAMVVPPAFFNAHNGLGEDASPVRFISFSAHNGRDEDIAPVLGID